MSAKKTLLDIQQHVRVFCDKYEIVSPIEHRVLDLVSEIGEVAKEILKMTDYGKSSLNYREEIKQELGDVFYSLITVANYFNIDLGEALELAIKKYEKRLKEKGSLGSDLLNYLFISHLTLYYGSQKILRSI